MLTPAHAQEGAAHGDDRDTVDRAGDIAAQPIRDIGIMGRNIPQVLQDAVSAPYAMPSRVTCTWLRAEHARLDDALGPDFDQDVADNQSKAEKLAMTGGEMLVNSIIPFRGIVREVSGAAAADRRRLAAMNAGLARRGYIRGLASARRCTISVAESE